MPTAVHTCGRMLSEDTFTFSCSISFVCNQSCVFPHQLLMMVFLVGSILRNGTERNDGLNYGTERFLKLKPAVYRC